MENSEATQLSEVDSLSDRFVESLMEPTAPMTPSKESEKPDDCKHGKLLESHMPNELSNGASTHELVVAEEQVTLPEKYGCLGSQESSDVCHDGILELREKNLIVRSGSATSTSTSSLGRGLESGTISEKGKGGLDAETNHAKEAQLENQKSQKETTEVKRKSSRRSFKTEQEFLEFTLKYKQVLTERDAAISVKVKLESLCRELQRQNKLLMQECKNVSEEGQNLRIDLSNKFQDVIKDVSNKVEAQRGECLSQLKENEMLKDELKQLSDQYSLSQQQYTQEVKQKTLELKIAELNAQQNEEKLAQEQAQVKSTTTTTPELPLRWAKCAHTSILSSKAQVKSYAEKIAQHLETEKSLRLQLAADGEKFQQFQDALLKSNEVFGTFRQEMEKMTKLTRELEKENTFLKSKCEKSDVTLIELIQERERMKLLLEKTKNQKQKLESLCRLLQAERKQSSAIGT